MTMTWPPIPRAAAKSVTDPVWRMPLWDGYDDMLKSEIADLSNSSEFAAGRVR